MNWLVKIAHSINCATIKEHFELGRRPRQPAYPGKVDRESECGSIRSNQAGSVGPPDRRAFLFADSVIDPVTIQAYLETDYRVHAEPPFALRVGHMSSDLLTTHKTHRAGSSAFITACNPFSQQLDEAENQDRQRNLAAELSRRGLTFLQGIGQHPSNNWPGEDSFLVLGLNLEAAKALGQRFEQNALVWSASDAIPQLILLR